MKTVTKHNRTAAKVAASGNGTAKGSNQPTLKVVKNDAKKTSENPPKAKQSAEEKTNSLQGALKVVDSLHRKVVQRANLIAVIDTLESFTIKQVENEHGGEFVGCEITIKDDNRGTWSTKNTYLIASIIQFAKATCVNRLAEIEAGIKLPAA